MPQITMDDHLLREIEKKLDGAKDAHVKVGVLQSHGGGEKVAGGGDVTLAELLAIHEFGAPRANIPARQPLRRTFTESEGREALSKVLTNIGRRLVSEKLELGDALEKLGMWAVSQVKKRIKMGLPPPLRPATVKAKGSSTPLVDTGQLINAITYEVKK